MAFPTSPSDQDTYTSGEGVQYIYTAADDRWDIVNSPVNVEFGFAASNEADPLVAITDAFTIRAPFAFTLTEVRASVKTAPTGSGITVDINENGVSVLSTKLTIDAGEKTSQTAATPPVISDANIADDAELTIDIDAVGSTVKGTALKVWLIGVRV